MEYIEETVRRLHQKFGREPAPDEIKTERDRLFRLVYADMAITTITLADEKEEP
jgi:hypothetical protein